VIQRRIWPNSKYDWITAAGVLAPRTVYDASDAAPRMTLNYTLNEGAKAPSSESLRALRNLEEKYHLRDGKFTSE